MKRNHSKVVKTESGNSKQIKITSLFSRISHVSADTVTENNGNKTPMSNSKTFSSPVSSPDFIPPSPVLVKKKAIKAKRSIIHSLVDDVIHTAKLKISQAKSVPEKTFGITKKHLDKSKVDNYDVDTLDVITENPSISKSDNHDVNKLDVNIKSPDKLKVDDYDGDYQSCIGTESMASTICDENDLSDVCFDEWTDFSYLDSKDIDLTQAHRCVIKKIEKEFGKICLTLNSCKNEDEQSVCYLNGVWFHSLFEVGDIVTVMAKKINELWSVNNDHGFVARHSDFLVSGTTISGSLFCSRRTVLADLYKGFDSTPSNMVMGTLLHEFLQMVLKRDKFHYKDIEAIVHEIINKPSFVRTIYASDMNKEATEKELMEFIPKIQSFIKTYMINYKEYSINKYDKRTWQGEIESIHDIEENLWVPQFGVKGKVDITVQVKRDGMYKIMPIELKTGRASGSAEHRGQVILYVIMMAELGMNVDSGLLLYLRENVLTEVKVEHKEKRDLIMLRNQLVHYLYTNKAVPHLIDNYFPILPEPINRHAVCSSCPYLTMCSAILSKEGFEKLDHQHVLQSLGPQAISHLKSEHINYVMRWTALLQLENNIENTKENSIAKTSDTWTLPNEEREKRGQCIASLMITKAVKEQDNYYLHTMEKSDSGFHKDFTLTFSVNNYLMVSTNYRNAIATGFISAITEKSIDLLLDRDLTKLKPSLYHLDKLESQWIVMFNIYSLALLLEPSESSLQLRRFIIDKEIPSFLSFSGHLDSFIESTGLTLNLNSSQRSAIIKVLAADHYTLIKGMPGTGKTSTVATLIQLLVLMGRSVLVTSHTNSAVDNLLLLLHKNGIDFLRLGTTARVHPDLLEKCDSVVSQTCDTSEKLSKLYNQANIVGVTALGCGHMLFQKRTFDVCIVDEATQAVQPSLIAALHSSKMFILVGDPQQLPPLIKNKKAKELGMDVSMFERLDRPSVTAVLNLQYRMNGSIAELANKYTYNGSLQCANDTVKCATIKLNEINVDDEWLKYVISSDLNKSVLLLDTGTVGSSSSSSTDTNLTEVKVVNKIVLHLIKGGLLGKSIGVIAPYRAQVELLKNDMSSVHSDIEVNTVDQYQGRDKEVIIYSCTKNNVTKDVGILSDKRRITVAITRAKYKLIMIGDVTTMKNYDTFNNLFSHITNIIKLPKI